MTAEHSVDAVPDDFAFDIEQLCRLAGVDVRWVQQRVADGFVATCTGAEDSGWRFDAIALRRVQRLVRLERDFDAVPELAALVADLEEEIRALRARLQRLGVPPEGG